MGAMLTLICLFFAQYVWLRRDQTGKNFDLAPVRKHQMEQERLERERRRQIQRAAVRKPRQPKSNRGAGKSMRYGKTLGCYVVVLYMSDGLCLRLTRPFSWSAGEDPVRRAEARRNQHDQYDEDSTSLYDEAHWG